MKKIFLILFFITGCAQVFDPDGKEQSKFGARSVFTADQPIENIDIIYLLTNGQDGDSANGINEPLTKENFSHRFDDALRKFNPPDEIGRNRLQDRIIISSNELCETYKTVLKRKQARFNQWAGAVSVVSAAAGTIAPAETTAKIWSGISGSSTGIRAEYNQNYFSNLAAHAIAKGINKRRGDILEKVNEARTKKLSEYTAEMAIADAIVYHGACSLIGGLEQLDSAVTTIDVNVGLDALGANAIFKKYMKEEQEEQE